MIFGTPQVAATLAYLTQMVLRGAAPQRGAKNHAALRGGSEMPRLLCCRISQTHYLESARSSAAHTGHFRPIAIPAITRTGSWEKFTKPCKTNCMCCVAIHPVTGKPTPQLTSKADVMKATIKHPRNHGCWAALRQDGITYHDKPLDRAMTHQLTTN